MRADEVSGAGALIGLTLAGGAARVQEVHTAIARRVFTGVGVGVGSLAGPVRLSHDAVAATSYGVTRIALRHGIRLAGILAAQRFGDGDRLADRPRGSRLLAVLNGTHGDLMAREAAGLALPMTLRVNGRDVPPARSHLAAAFSSATARLAVFLHGLVEDEKAWQRGAERHHGLPGVTYGSLLARDLGYTPVWIRYNSGLHISDNGRALGELLEHLVEHWPIDVERVVLIGHSMGGLVGRSALAHAAEREMGSAGAWRWPDVVQDTVTLGSPHLGAPLERGANVLTHALHQLNETRPLGAVLASRSAGIKDLRYGNLVEADWLGHSPDALLSNRRTHIPLHARARHFVVLTTVLGSDDSRIGDLVGDLLVRPKSARGESGDEHRWELPEGHILRLRGLHHLDLLNHPKVYERLRSWLADGPAV